MKQHLKFFLFFLFFYFGSSFAADISFWNTQRKGANIFNQNMFNNEEIWQAANDANIQFVRLAPNKWQSNKQDFLIGDADDYQTLDENDLNQLKKVLDTANENGVKIVLTMLNLPGCRWKQLNNNHDDQRLWQTKKYQKQAIHFWQDLAKELSDHPAIVAYNIINEPHPEVALGYNDFSDLNFNTFSKNAAGTAADLSLFYQKIVDAIREVDPNTPIILDVGMYADPRAFSYFKPIHGENILYAFHMYEPFDYTNKQRNDGQYAYPGEIPVGNHQSIYVDKNTLQFLYLAPVMIWQQKYHIPSNRIIVEEFGGHRTAKGLDKYFTDLISIFNKKGWHWAFYSFREDTWDGMNYELGGKPLGQKYWAAVDRGEHPELKPVDNPIWDVLWQNLTGSKTIE